jgi:hypothetical protein
VQLGWLRQEHVEWLGALLERLEAEEDRVVCRELLLGVSQDFLGALFGALTRTATTDPRVPLTRQELLDVQELVAKGVNHNGLVPTLDTVRVGQALQVVAELLARADLAALSQQDQYLLEWVFDVGAGAPAGPGVEAVRRVELQVRAALGLRARLLVPEPVNVDAPW